jgi:hypothetical protein
MERRSGEDGRGGGAINDDDHTRLTDVHQPSIVTSHDMTSQTDGAWCGCEFRCRLPIVFLASNSLRVARCRSTPSCLPNGHPLGAVSGVMPDPRGAAGWTRVPLWMQTERQRAKHTSWKDSRMTGIGAVVTRTTDE